MNLPANLKTLFKPVHQGLEAERTALIAKMRKLYRFLETDFGYTYTLIKETDKHPGGPKYYINQYTNLSAQRMVEITLHRNSTPLYFYVKRLKDGAEPSYADNDNCFAFYEIDLYNGIDDHDRHNPYLEPDYEFGNVKSGREILLSIPGILKGTEWFDRAKLDRISMETRGYPSGRSDNPLFGMIKKAFSFLTQEHGFTIIHDYDRLRPFEQHLGGSVVYDNGKTTVHISVDLRDQDFTVYLFNTDRYDPDKFWLSGETVFSGAVSEEELLRAANQVETSINSRA